MTHQRLAELLHERVSDVTAPDLAEAAWHAGTRVRRRRTLAALSGVVGLVIVVSGGFAVLDRQGATDRPAPATHAPSPTEAPTVGAVRAPSSPEYAGTEIWWGPTVSEEGRLPALSGGPLPSTVDLAAGSSVVRLDSAAAVFALPSGADVLPIHDVLAIGSNGERLVIDVARLGPVEDRWGNAFSPLTATSLSPDGRHVFFAQRRSLEVYELATATWSTIATPPWRAELARWTDDDQIFVPASAAAGAGGDVYGPDGRHSMVEAPPDGAISDPRTGDAYGPAVSNAAGDLAQSYYLARDLPGPSQTPPEAVVIEGARPSILAMPPEYGPRFKGCCASAGWLDDDTVLYWSDGQSVRLLAWRVGTPRISVVSDIVGGQFAAASLADPSRR